MHRPFFVFNSDQGDIFGHLRQGTNFPLHCADSACGCGQFVLDRTAQTTVAPGGSYVTSES